MNPRRSFVRKIVYLVAIVLLLIPLFWLSQPETPSTKAGRGGAGGQLSQLRQQYGLSEAQLGDIDPTSETIKLATLGMRGVATVFLWQKANDYKMRKDWTDLSATLNQLTKLEPHFVSVWRHQGWNLSYNVSAEFDDYRERYRWVMKGIDFLQQGIRYNRREPRLLWDIGLTVSQKIGRADESDQFRRLFKADDDFHGSRPLSERDNWLVGKEWLAKAEEVVAQGGDLGGISEVLFFSKKPMNQMDYAEALEHDGIFQEKARRAWKEGGEEWKDFGDRELSYVPNTTFRVNELGLVEEEIKETTRKLDMLEPGLLEKLIQQKRDVLSPEEREALDTLPEKRTAQQKRLARMAEVNVQVPPSELARRVSGPNQEAATKLSEHIADLEKKKKDIENACTVINYDMWRRRAIFEQDPATLAAREYIYEGDQAFRKADLIGARNAYNKGWAKWRELFDKQESDALANDRNLGEELVEMYNHYRIILEKCDEQLPKDFPLDDIIQPHLKRLMADRVTQQQSGKEQGKEQKKPAEKKET